MKEKTSKNTATKTKSVKKIIPQKNTRAKNKSAKPKNKLVDATNAKQKSILEKINDWIEKNFTLFSNK